MNAADDADLERRFGGLRRLYGGAGYARIRAARVAVVGLGGVGSWAAEALARSGVAALTLIDLDHVAESNINRQVQATGATLGMGKARALALRVADIHPACDVHEVEAFVDSTNWPALLPGPVDALVDACDDVRAKLALATWSTSHAVPVVSVGAAGGKRDPAQVAVADLSQVTHDPLLASLRQRWRQQGSGARGGMPMGLRCVFSAENVARPESEAGCDHDGSLNCHGYGSSVAVTATFGFAAAAEVLTMLATIPTSADRVVSSVGRAADF